MNAGLLWELDHCYERALALCAPLSEDELRAQYHRDLSPAAWHLGHIAVVGAHWTQYVLCGETLPQPWTELYFPEHSVKAERGARAPGRAELFAWVDDLRNTTLARLGAATTRDDAHALMHEDYLLHFLIQHHEQHLETLQQILQQRALTLPTPMDAPPLAASAPRPPSIALDLAETEIGHPGGVEAYDNELPRHRVPLSPYAIAERAVSNAEYLGFMSSDGYGQRRYWSAAGWRWREANGVRAPDHWRRGESGGWFAVTSPGAATLAPDEAVSGISYYEAEAYARYAGCRLPHECEWETAAARGIIAADSIGAWEWCAQPFYPYPGFRAFPYREYSVPWFDGRHYTLRGGSVHTCARIKRPTFRNYYTADKRHVFAGVRLAQDR